AARHGQSLLLIRWYWLAGWLNGCTVDQELSAGDDDLVTGRQAAGHGIVIADGVAESYGALLGDVSVPLLGSYVNEWLPADTRNRQYRDGWRGSRAPNHPRLHQLFVAEPVERSVDGRFHQNTLQSVVHLLRNEINI